MNNHIARSSTLLQTTGRQGLSRRPVPKRNKFHSGFPPVPLGLPVGSVSLPLSGSPLLAGPCLTSWWCKNESGLGLPGRVVPHRAAAGYWVVHEATLAPWWPSHRPALVFTAVCSPAVGLKRSLPSECRRVQHHARKHLGFGGFVTNLHGRGTRTAGPCDLHCAAQCGKQPTQPASNPLKRPFAF